LIDGLIYAGPRDRAVGQSAGGPAGHVRSRGREDRRVDWRVADQTQSAGPASVPVVNTWSIMLAIWPLEERPDEMRRMEVVNSLSFDQMVTYKKLYDAGLKKEGKGEEVFGRDGPIPVTMFKAEADDCAEQLHAVR
jgi:hypothetical protein